MNIVKEIRVIIMTYDYVKKKCCSYFEVEIVHKHFRCGKLM